MVFLTVRELIQLFIADNKLRYFKKKSNLLELALIVASWKFIFSETSYRVPAGFIILISSIEILILLPSSKLSTYMFMLKTVSETFMKFFWIFLVVILAFTFSFYSMFRPTLPSPEVLRGLNETAEMNFTMDHCDRDKNFEGIIDSFLKTTLMLSGNNGMEPHSLNSFWEKLIFFIFMITALVLLNLINGLAISDIQVYK